MFKFIKKYLANRKAALETTIDIATKAADKVEAVVKIKTDKIRADIFINVGRAYRPAQYLRKFKLRTFSSPFDWMMSYSLNDAARLIKCGGAGFFTHYAELERGAADYPHHKFVQDSQTGMISMHDFPRTASVRQHYGEFAAKYKRRFEALKKAICAARHIVFVANRNEDEATFEAFLRQMREFHAASYTFINIRHDEGLKS